MNMLFYIAKVCSITRAGRPVPPDIIKKIEEKLHIMTWGVDRILKDESNSQNNTYSMILFYFFFFKCTCLYSYPFRRK